MLANFKKHLVFILAAAILLVSLPLSVLTTSAWESIEIWDGTVSGTFAGGNGSESNPFIITNGAQLARAIDMGQDAGGQGIGGGGGQYFKITEDIYLNDITVENWYNNSNNNAWMNANGQWRWGFNGHLDGDGHIIYGIWYPQDAQSGYGHEAFAGAGLIPVYMGGSIKNLGVRYSQINAALYAGGIVGTVRGRNPMAIDQCFVDDTVTVRYNTNGNGGAGGIVGYYGNAYLDSGAALKISNCYSKASLSNVAGNANRTNGIIATAWESSWSIENCYSVGYAPYYASNNQEFSNAPNARDLFKNIYSDSAVRFPDYQKWSQVSANSIKGNDAKTNMPGLDYDTIFATVNGDTPVLRVFDDIPVIDQQPGGDSGNTGGDSGNTGGGSGNTGGDSGGGNLGSVEIWDGTVSGTFAGGNGSESNPFIITNGAQLARAIDMGQDAGGQGIGGGGGQYFKITKDIYLNDISTENWYENSNNKAWLNDKGQWRWGFNGHIDGDGHIIYGIWYPQDAQSGYGHEAFAGAGLIPVYMGGSIKNLGVRYSQINAALYAGGIVGTVRGRNPMAIDQCFVDDTVTVRYNTNGNGGAAGIVGYYGNAYLDSGAALKISNCYSKASLSNVAGNANRTNGIIATAWESSWSIENCYSVSYAPYYASNNQEFSNAPNARNLFKNIYSNVGVRFPDYQLYTYVTNLASMQGESAKTYMAGLDYENIFKTVVDDTPILRVFGDIPDIDQQPGGGSGNTGGDSGNTGGDSGNTGGDSGNTGGGSGNTGGGSSGSVEIWDGTVASSFAGGNGTINSPYRIENGAQLARAIDVGQDAGGQGIGGGGGQYFKLTKDIYLNDVTIENWYENSNNRAWLNANGQWTWGFNGHLDGDGHVVYGIWYPQDAQSGYGNEAFAGAGLVPVFMGGSIKNLGVRYSQINAALYAGGIVGTVRGRNSMVIDQCFADDTVTSSYNTTGNGGAAGIVGYYSNAYIDSGAALKISNCYSKASLSNVAGNAKRTNGILATAWESSWSIENCYSVGFAPYYASNNQEFSNAPNAATLCKNNYSDVAPLFPEFEKWSQVSANSMKGDAAKDSMSALDFDSIFAAIEGDTPVLRVFGNLPNIDQQPGGGNTGGDSGNTGGDSGNTGGDSGNTGGDSGNTGGDSGNTGGDSGNTGGDSGNTGGDSGNTGGDSGNTGGDSGNTGGDSGNTGGNNNTGNNNTGNNNTGDNNINDDNDNDDYNNDYNNDDYNNDDYNNDDDNTDDDYSDDNNVDDDNNDDITTGTDDSNDKKDKSNKVNKVNKPIVEDSGSGVIIGIVIALAALLVGGAGVILALVLTKRKAKKINF